MSYYDTVAAGIVLKLEPFEGAGAVSRWRLALPHEFRAFDYGTISDVVVHLRYTARDGGQMLASGSRDHSARLWKAKPN